MAYPAVDSALSRAPRDVESVALLKHTLLWRRPDFEEQPEEKEAAARAVTEGTPRRATVFPVVAGRCSALLEMFSSALQHIVILKKEPECRLEQPRKLQ